MTFDQIKQKAKKMGLKSVGIKKEQLIKNIQIAEGNFACFGTAIGNCDQPKCCWSKDCISKN